MIKNHIMTALRNLLRNKLHSGINIVGLSIGITTGILILTFVLHELSYDRFFRNSDRIYRLVMDEYANGDESLRATAYPNFHREMLGTYPDIESSVRLQNRAFAGTSDIVRTKENIFPGQKVYYGDSTFFDVFSFRILYKILPNPLVGKGQAVITRSAAIRYFGSPDASGQSFRLNDVEEFTVTAVMEDIPSNCHFHFDVLLSMDSHPWEQQANWNGTIFATYFLLKKGVSGQQMEKHINSFISNHEQIKPNINENYWMKGIMQPLTDIHLHSNYGYELEANGDYFYVMIFLTIAIFILLVACINYINLETARALERAREVGLRKVFGAGKGVLIRQFLGESFLIVVVAFILAMGTLEIVRPLFNSLVGTQFRFLDFFSETNIYIFLILIPAMGFISGLYPAFIISGYKPNQVLRGRLKSSNKGIYLRKSLVIFQFILSLSLILGSMVIYRQLRYVQNKDLGINKDQIMVIPMNTIEVRKNRKLIISEFEKQSNILVGSGVSQVPVNVTMREGISRNMGYSAEDPMMYFLEGDRNIFKALGLKIVQGHVFNNEYSMEYSEYVVNEEGMKLLGPELQDVVNHNIRVKHNGLTLGPVIGIVKDFNFASLHDDIGPLVICQNPDRYQFILFKVNTTDIKSTLSYMQNTWKSIFPDLPFDYRFLDQEYDNLYKMDSKAGQIMFIFTLMAIFIAVIGLFGLSSYEAIQRTREVGIRKVLGSDVGQIIALFVKENLKLILIASAIAVPVGFISMNKWLESFSFRISIGVGIPLIAVSVVIFIALLTVIFHAIKAAITDPVKTLRYE